MKDPIIAARELAPHDPAPPPLDHATFVRMSEAYVELVKKLLGSAGWERKRMPTNPLAENVRRFLAASRDMSRVIPDFAAQERAEILRKAPVVAHALLRFATEVYLLAPVVDRMLEQSSIQKFVSSRLNKLKMVEDVICELSYFAWLQSKGLIVDLKQLPGEPEGVVRFDHQDLCVEVKTIHRLDTNVSKRIGEANRQIKHAGIEANGICVVRYPKPLDPYKRELALAKLIEGIQIATRSRQYRSVAAVVLEWDEVLVEEHQQDVWLFTSRGSRLYVHAHAHRPLSGNLQDLCPAAYAAARVVLRPSEEAPTRIA
jgi:hypothetical protein